MADVEVKLRRIKNCNFEAVNSDGNIDILDVVALVSIVLGN
jgi:hypothetical protein